MKVSDDRLAALTDNGGQGASEMEVAVIAAELLARRAGARELLALADGPIPDKLTRQRLRRVFE
jgi:hypothetical protein